MTNPLDLMAKRTSITFYKRYFYTSIVSPYQNRLSTSFIYQNEVSSNLRWNTLLCIYTYIWNIFSKCIINFRKNILYYTNFDFCFENYFDHVISPINKSISYNKKFFFLHIHINMYVYVYFEIDRNYYWIFKF